MSELPVDRPQAGSSRPVPCAVMQADGHSSLQSARQVRWAMYLVLALVLTVGQAQDSAGLLLDARWFGVSVLILVLLTGVMITEFTARRLLRQASHMEAQAAEVRRLALVAEHTSALVLITDAQDQVVWVNGAFCEAFGLRADAVMGCRALDIGTHPRAQEAVLLEVRQALSAAQGLRREWLHRSASGQDIWLDVDMQPLFDSRQRLSGYVRVAADVTERVLQQVRRRALWAALPTGVLVVDANGLVTDINRAGEALLGLSLAQLQGRHVQETSLQLVRDDGSPYTSKDLPVLRTLYSGKPLSNESMGLLRPGQSPRWLLVNTEPHVGAQGETAGVVVCFSDVTERRLLQDKLRGHARTDALTLLPNRSVVMERLAAAIAHARKYPEAGFGVLFMDFDRFKQVNDTLGHGAGDDLLRQIAQRLSTALRPGDAVARAGDDGSTAARLGGDEFVVLLDRVASQKDVTRVAQRLLEVLSKPYELGGAPVHSSASIGVVWLKGGHMPESITADDILRDADTAMYEAKRGGRGRWVLFDSVMHEKVVHALALENDLREALAHDQLFVVYQPVIDLASRQMTGVEALARWKHPVRGMVPPLEFIPVAEESGLIDALGEKILRLACAQFVSWRESLGDLAPRLLAVNLSRAQLRRAQLVDEVRLVLEQTGMEPSWLQLEVTESLAAQDDQIQVALRELKSLGVKLALDDFGTGYSSLACLHLMPVDTVKVDRSFVKHAENVEYHRVLIEATIRVARTLGMTTVAEGIETEAQAALMLQLECDRGQGYLFSRPLEAAGIVAWVQQSAELVV